MRPHADSVCVGRRQLCCKSRNEIDSGNQPALCKKYSRSASTKSAEQAQAQRQQNREMPGASESAARDPLTMQDPPNTSHCKQLRQASYSWQFAVLRDTDFYTHMNACMQRFIQTDRQTDKRHASTCECRGHQFLVMGY